MDAAVAVRGLVGAVLGPLVVEQVALAAPREKVEDSVAGVVVAAWVQACQARVVVEVMAVLQATAAELRAVVKMAEAATMAVALLEAAPVATVGMDTTMHLHQCHLHAYQ